MARLAAGHWPVYHAARATTGARRAYNRNSRSSVMVKTYRFECVLHMQADSESDAWQELREELEFLSSQFGNIISFTIENCDLTEED